MLCCVCFKTEITVLLEISCLKLLRSSRRQSRRVLRHTWKLFSSFPSSLARRQTADKKGAVRRDKCEFEASESERVEEAQSLALVSRSRLRRSGLLYSKLARASAEQKVSIASQSRHHRVGPAKQAGSERH